MRPISIERVEKTRENILGIITNKALTHEQKLTNLANAADGMLEVLDVPEGLDDLLNCDDEHRCICDLFEGHAPMRPRYIIPDYEKFFENGSEFLQLDPPTDFFEALNDLLIIYKHVPSVTNYPVYLGQLDYLLEPFITDMDDATVKKHLKLFFTNVDRTVLDSFSHADIGPKATRAGYLILEVQAELENAIPNISMKYDPEITDDDFALACVKCALKTAKPSFANHRMFKNELGENYVIASCYNGLLLGGGAYTLCRLILGHIAERSVGIEDFKNNQLPYVMDIMAKYMDARIAFEVEQSGFFESNFLAKEGLINRDGFTGMFGLVGLADAVNALMAKECKDDRFGHSDAATKLGVEIMDIINAFNNNHFNKYCEGTGNHFLLHAQVGIAEDKGIAPGTRIPIGEEPDELVDHLNVISNFHKYFVSGTGDIFPVDLTVHKNPEYVLDIIKGSCQKDIRYLSFYSSDSDVIRITGYLVKRSEIEKYEQGNAVLQNTTQLGTGAKHNGKILERKVR